MCKKILWKDYGQQISDENYNEAIAKYSINSVLRYVFVLMISVCQKFFHDFSIRRRSLKSLKNRRFDKNYNSNLKQTDNFTHKKIINVHPVEF